MQKLQQADAEVTRPVGSGPDPTGRTGYFMLASFAHTREPTVRLVLAASILGGALGALAAAAVYSAVPALMFGAAIGAYSGFLVSALEALGSGDLPD